MPLLAVPIVAVLALFLVIVGITIAYFYVARITKDLDRLKLQLESSSMLMSEFSNTNQLLQNHVNIVEKDIKSITTEHSKGSRESFSLKLELNVLSSFGC